MFPRPLLKPQPERVLPDGWTAEWDRRYQQWYYVNLHTEQSQWQRPTQAAEDAAHSANGSRRGTPRGLPDGWKAEWDTKYEEWYYANIYTKQSQWQRPTEPARSPLDPTLSSSISNFMVRSERRLKDMERILTTEPTPSSGQANSKPDAKPSASTKGEGKQETKITHRIKPVASSRASDQCVLRADSADRRSLETRRVDNIYKKLPGNSFVRVLELKPGLKGVSNNHAQRYPLLLLMYIRIPLAVPFCSQLA